MFNFLLFIILFFIIAVVAVIAVAARFLWRGYHMFRNLNQGKDRRQGRGWQYDAGVNRETSGRHTRTSSGETIIDARDSDTASRKIFSENEGEYVDFEETSTPEKTGKDHLSQ